MCLLKSLFDKFLGVYTLLVVAMCIVCVFCQNNAGQPQQPGLAVQSACLPPCIPVEEMCVKLSRCVRKRCHMCAETKSVAANFKCPMTPGDMEMDIQRQMQIAMQLVLSQMLNKTAPTTRPTKETGIFGGNPMTDFFMTGRLMGAEGMGLGFMGL